METIADALVYAVAYINCRSTDDSDADVRALESIASFLHKADLVEQNTLAIAAKRALAAEIASVHPRPDFVRVYSRWMQDTFGEPWRGNDQTQ